MSNGYGQRSGGSSGGSSGGGGQRGSYRRPERPGGGQRRGFRGKKVCRYCKNKDIKIEYKEAKALRPFISERGKIVPRRISGNCAKHQREVCTAVKRARNIALIPFTTISMWS